ncbi:MAG: amylo-alpha-1,6-glucosidase [Acholeplasmataceae bacterium]|jgi:cellobiose phosphorylase|nr:amylo-alpha-1,6-glucosidase [Acholeplasmataceae bacterium]
MILKNSIKTISLTDGGISFNLLSSGDIFDMTYQDRQINLLKGNAIDGSLANLYLRIYSDNQIKWTRLIGKHSPSIFTIKENEAIYEGVFEGVSYQVHLTLENLKWQWTIYLSSKTEVEVDVIYGQDIAIASKSSVLSSEPYTVQYIDYKAFKDEMGYTLCARQNQGATQYLQIGSFDENIAYTTDGFQFFGLSYKETNVPKALYEPLLISEIYQYEFSYFALQSHKIRLNQHTEHMRFYGLYEPNFEGAITTKKDVKQIQTSPHVFKIQSKNQQHQLSVLSQLNGNRVDKKHMELAYNFMEHIEMDDDELLSFFTKNNHHVVLKQKELVVERPHGHLMVHGDLLHVSDEVMATTNFMYGLFNSHVVLGNSSFNKFLGDSRNPLNVQKISGQRIYIKVNGTYHILGLPSYYEMGATLTKWVYVFDDDQLVITSYVNINHLQQTLTVSSTMNKKYDVIIASQIVMGNNEYLYDIEYENSDSTLTFKAPKTSMMFSKYPSLFYRMESSNPFEIIDEKRAFGTQDDMGILLLKYTDISNLKIDTLASIDGTDVKHIILDHEEADDIGTRYIQSILKYLDVKHPIFESNFKKLNQLSFWYTHNALVHYASPHGLEQYNGAAWGTRDVCQGPIELFMAAQKFDLVREILLKVYQRQFVENGDFPQWYMFDKYYTIQAHEAHGDIIIWPLRTLAYYLKATGDLSILNEMIPSMSMKENGFTKDSSLLDHVKFQIESIKKTFIQNTYLPKYGGGDWDDTLQPANHDLTEKMVSGWTVALLYEALYVFSNEIKSILPELADDYHHLASKVKEDYDKYLIVDGIPSGFVIFDQEIKYLLHPRDYQTGLKYRLLPITRSMISGIMKFEQKETYLDIIDTHLKHPDGVRLMDTTVDYQGGLKSYFQRAETAANFGREIGLQYVHAHIRYIEAMSKIGHADEAYKGLFEINPILIQKAVPHALPRQSNMYFSSSDANFKHRYEAKQRFNDIKVGKVGVKGGWRLYSSGPGIYIKQLITSVYGISVEHGDLVLDPVIPKKQEGLSLNYHYLGKPLVMRVHFGDKDPLFMGKAFDFERMLNPYRKGGIKIKKSILDAHAYLDFDVWI